MLRIERCGTARIGVSLLDYVELWSIKSFRHGIYKLRRVCLRFCAVVCAVSVLSAFHTDRCRLWLVLVSQLCEVACVRCVRALNFVHYVRCVKICYARRLRTLRKLLQKPPYVVAVVDFCVYLIHLSLWYCKSRQRSFVRIFMDARSA